MSGWLSLFTGQEANMTYIIYRRGNKGHRYLLVVGAASYPVTLRAEDIVCMTEYIDEARRHL